MKPLSNKARCFVALLLAGCAEPQLFIALPPAPAEAKALIVAFEGPDAEPTLEARNLGEAPSFEFEGGSDESARAFVLFLAHSLLEEQIPSGRLPSYRGVDGRRLPASVAIASSPVDAAMAGAWQPAELSPALEQLRIGPFDALACVQGGGCFADDRPLCTAPCPEPAAPDPPVPPLPPEAPNILLNGDCNSSVAGVLGQVPLQSCRVAPARPSCAADEVESERGPACLSIGEPCASGDYGPAPSTGRVLYVHVAATPGGDGSLAAPYARIADAILSSDADTTILLSKGTFASSVALDRPLLLRGACAGGTVLRAGQGEVVVAHRSSATLERLTLKNDERTCASVKAGASLHLRDVLIESSQGVAALVEPGGTLDVDGSVLRGGASNTLTARGQVSLTRTVVDVSGHTGLWATGPDAVLTARQLTVRSERADRPFAKAVLASHGATLDVDGALIERANGPAFAAEAGAHSTVRNVIVRQSGSSTNAITLYNLKEDTVGVLDRALITRETGAAIFVGSRARASISNLETSLRQPSSGPDSYSIGAGEAEQISLSRVRVDGALGAALSIRVERLSVEDLEVREVLSIGSEAPGVCVAFGAETSTFSRVSLSHCPALGLEISDGRRTYWSDLTIEHANNGLVTRGSSSVIGERIAISDRIGLALNSSNQGSVFLSNLWVGPAATELATAAVLQDRAASVCTPGRSFQLDHFYISGDRRAGISLVFDATAKVSLSDGVVEAGQAGLELTTLVDLRGVLHRVLLRNNVQNVVLGE